MPISLSKYLTDFTLNNKRKGLQPSSIKTYISHINYFIAYLGDTDDLSAEQIESYCSHITNSSLSVNSMHSYLRDVRIFVHYIDEQLGTAYADSVVLPRTHQKLVHIFTPDEIQRIYSALLTTRDRLIFALAYDCGLRRMEICGLRCNDISDRMFKVFGKGQKERYVPYGQVTRRLISAYLAERHSDSEYLILTKYQRPFTVDGLSNWFRKLSAASGFDFSAHDLRHNFATNYLINQIEQHGSTDLFQLQMILGHSDQSVTKIYLHIAQQLLIARNSYSHLDALVSQMVVPIGPEPTRSSQFMSYNMM